MVMVIEKDSELYNALLRALSDSEDLMLEAEELIKEAQLRLKIHTIIRDSLREAVDKAT